MSFGAAFAAATGLQVLADLKEGRDAQKIANENAAILFQDAAERRLQGEDEVRIARADQERDLGTLQANIAASGLQLSGSPLLVLNESLTNAQLDLAAIKRTAENEARRLESGGRISIKQGRQAGQAGFINAATSLLTAGLKFSQLPKKTTTTTTTGGTGSTTPGKSPFVLGFSKLPI